MDNTARIIGQAVAKAPSWIKNELVSADPAYRQRAEEALAAIINAALANAASSAGSEQ